MKKQKLSTIRALEIRVHNLEIALVAQSAILEAAAGPRTSENLNAIATHLFECSSDARGFQSAKMIAPRVVEE